MYRKRYLKIFEGRLATERKTAMS